MSDEVLNPGFPGHSRAADLAAAEARGFQRAVTEIVEALKASYPQHDGWHEAVTFIERRFGAGSREAERVKDEPCPDCDGKGHVNGHDCPTCEATGTVWR